jgi:CBS domain-containing protein
LIVSEAFPKIFSRYAPVLDGGARLREAVRILTSPQVSAVIVSEKDKSKNNESRYSAIAGYHILSKLLTEELSFSKMLDRPCTFAALPIKVLNEGEPVEAVLKAIAESRLGVVLISRSIGSSEVLTTVELRDFIRMHKMGGQLREGDLKIGDLASSPVLSVRREDTLRQVLRVMLKHKKRKVLLYETRTVISDRDILNFLISSNNHELIKEQEELLEVKASQLPSSFPPFVDSEMNVNEAARLMNPDDGDCLICDKGLVTFWDLVVKLEDPEHGNKPLIQLSDATEKHDLDADASFQRSSDFTKNLARGQMDISPDRLKVLDGIMRTMKKHGFIDSQSVPRFAKQRIVDPLYFESPAREFHIWGVNAGQKGGRKFTSLDLFGHSLHESYYVSDWGKFAVFLGMKLEVMFRAKNPSPPRQLRLAFTRFMHDFGLHWTECNHGMHANPSPEGKIKPKFDL